MDFSVVDFTEMHISNDHPFPEVFSGYDYILGQARVTL